MARAREMRNSYRVLVGKPERKRPLAEPKRRWKDIKMYLKKIDYEGVDWINLAQYGDKWRAVVNAVMKHRVPQNAGNFLTS